MKNNISKKQTLDYTSIWNLEQAEIKDTSTFPLADLNLTNVSDSQTDEEKKLIPYWIPWTGWC